MNEVQKKWKKEMKEYNPTEYDKIYRSPRRKVEKRRKGIPALVTTFLVIAATAGITYVQHYNDSFFEKIGAKESSAEFNDVLQGSVVQSNKNGVIMHQNISELMDIFSDVQDNMDKITAEEITKKINRIQEMDLSEEYDTLKEKSVEKLKKAKEYREAYKKAEKTKSESKFKKLEKQLKRIVEEYNAIDIDDYIAEAFDKAEVKYTKSDKLGVQYQYYN